MGENLEMPSTWALPRAGAFASDSGWQLVETVSIMPCLPTQVWERAMLRASLVFTTHRRSCVGSQRSLF